MAAPEISCEGKVSKTARSPEELFPLIEFCRIGKLKEVSEWIANGHPIDPPQTSRRSRRPSPLQIAIEKGFFALAELLLDGGCDPMANGNALADAVGHRDVEISRLLLSRGVPMDSVDILSVFDGGPEIVKLFVEHGMDPTQDRAYFRGLCDNVHPLLFLLKGHKDRFPDLQRQAEMALCHYCDKENLLAVSLLLWAGARPDSEIPYPDYPDDPDLRTHALKEGVRRGNLSILKRLKPQNYPERLKVLLDETWGNVTQPVIDYLLEAGAILNTKQNGGSKLLEHLLSNLDSRWPGAETGREGKICLIEHVTKLGAKWIPDEDAIPRHLRDNFRSLSPEQIIRVFQILKETDAATTDLLEMILASASFRKRLGNRLKAVERVLHPPPPSPSAATGSADVDIACSVSSRPFPNAEDLHSRAIAVMLEVLRENPSTHFTRRSVSQMVYAQTARRRLGLPKGDHSDLTPIFSKSAKILNGQLKTFIIEVPDQEWVRSSASFHAKLTGKSEWAQAIEEAWNGEVANEDFLSEPATRLLAMLRQGEIGSDYVTENILNAKLGLRAWDSSIEKYLEEIVSKTGAGLRWEAEGWYRDRKFQIALQLGVSTPKEDVGCMNSALDLKFAHYTRTDVEQAAQRFHELILKAVLNGRERLFLLSISSYKEFRQFFPGEDDPRISELVEFLEAMPLNPSVSLAYDFRSYARCWFVSVTPKVDWPSSVAAISDEISQPGLQERLGISNDAAKLLRWLERLPTDKLIGRLTPVVEEDCEKRIGIKCPWDSKNFPTYIQVLIDEINEKTDYDLRTQPWYGYHGVQTRIRIARKKTDLEEVLRRLQWMALQNGVSLDVAGAQLDLNRMISPGANAVFD